MGSEGAFDYASVMSMTADDRLYYLKFIHEQKMEEKRRADKLKPKKGKR